MLWIDRAARRSGSRCAASTATRSACARSATRRGCTSSRAFCIAGAVAGLAGALLAAHQQGVTPADAAFGTAVVALVSVIIGGAGTLWGPCLGAAVVVLVRDQIGPSLGGHGPLLLGVVFVAAVYLLPGGIAGALGAAAQEAAMTALLELDVGHRASSAACAPSTASTCGSTPARATG